MSGAYNGIYVGYSGSIWRTAYSALQIYSAQMVAATDPEQVAAISIAVLQTLLNGAIAVNMDDTASALQSEIASLQQIIALPLTLDTYSQDVVTNRLAAYEAAYTALLPLIPQGPFVVASNLSNGVPAIPDPGYLEYCSTFNYETPPSGLTVTNFTATAVSISTSFVNLANAISFFQGNQGTQIYDVAIREAQAAGIAASIVSDYTSGPVAANLSIDYIWNQIVTLPAMASVTSSITAAPFLYLNQQSAVVRNALLNIAQEIANFLLTLRQPLTNQINLTTVLNGETLLDVAARALGDFEQWTEIATLNNLSPPYLGPVSIPSAGVIGYGKQILLPTPNSTVSAAGQPPSYTVNYLGTDIYLGPINGAMPPWTGDYQIVTGYQNLAISLGRRLQTTLGKLIYHSDFGSRIPPEVGAVQDSSTAGQIAAYGKSALLSDPRVQQVLNATAFILGTNAIGFNGLVQPGGFGSTPLGVNEVISPSP